MTYQTTKETESNNTQAAKKGFVLIEHNGFLVPSQVISVCSETYLVPIFVKAKPENKGKWPRPHINDNVYLHRL